MIPFKLFVFSSLFAVFFFPASSLQAEPAATPQPTKEPAPKMQPKGQSYTKALIIHKPMPDPAWGKVVQYHAEMNIDPNTKAKETISCFVFQDDNGIVRIANYHEGEDGEGYWEVYQWDLP